MQPQTRYQETGELIWEETTVNIAPGSMAEIDLQVLRDSSVHAHAIQDRDVDLLGVSALLRVPSAGVTVVHEEHGSTQASSVPMRLRRAWRSRRWVG